MKMHTFTFTPNLFIDNDEGEEFVEKIPFIKYVRTKYSMGLKDAKSFADYLLDQPVGLPIDIRCWAEVYGVSYVLPPVPPVSFPDVPIRIDGTITFGGLSYTVTTKVDDLDQTVADVVQLVGAVRTVLAKYGVEF